MSDSFPRPSHKLIHAKSALTAAGGCNVQGPYFGIANYDTYFRALYDQSLVNGPALAQAVIDGCRDFFPGLRGYFGFTGPLPSYFFFEIFITPGSNGACHYNAGLDIYCDAFYGNDGDLICYLAATEASETMMNLQHAGWDPGGSNGEALSRILGSRFYPGKGETYGFQSAASWLDSNLADPTKARPDWVSNTEGTDGNFVSFGCGVLFINYMRFQLGIDLADITLAGGSTLAQTYKNLTGEDDPFPFFALNMEIAFPSGTPSGLANDNPFPLPISSISLAGIVRF